jgi:hypothetical protein
LQTALPDDLRHRFNMRLVEQLRGPDERLKRDLWGPYKATYDSPDRYADALESGRKRKIGVRTYSHLLDWVNKVRNRTVLAHGHIDANATDAEAAAEVLRRIADVTVGLPPDDHPFGPCIHNELVAHIKDTLVAPVAAGDNERAM